VGIVEADQLRSFEWQNERYFMIPHFSSGLRVMSRNQRDDVGLVP